MTGIRKNGEKFPVEITITKFEKGGKVFTAVVQDISDRIRRENEELKEQKLESLGVLAGGIAHDFNNILTAILGNTNLASILVKTGNTEKTIETLSNIENATIRARDLTRQLLTFSKGGEPVKKTVSIVELIKETSEFAIRGSNVKCEFFISNDLCPVEVDEGQITQVINNIVINAVQAMPEGGVINISAENIDEIDGEQVYSLRKGRYIKMCFRDYGSGINKEYNSNVFEPYFTTKENGSGLGLASSYSIIKRHNGSITFESEAGRGTTFIIYLPVSLKEVVKEEIEQCGTITGTGKILIMDDEEIIRDMVRQTLNFIGYEVECAKHGKEAIEMYKKAHEEGKPFDVVIMDLTVPGGMGGKEAIEKLHDMYPGAKAIVSSGYCDIPIMSNCQKYGFYGVISKPFNIKEMNDLLQKVINGG